MNKVLFTCKACGVSKEVDFYANKRRKTPFCKKCCSKETQTGIRRSSNRGRSYISSDGYKMVKVLGKYTKSGKPLYRREHILVMEKHIGRPLKTTRGGNGEQVHHIDGNKLNNSINNLLLCEDTSYHKSVDCQLHELAFELVRRGTISFNRESREYEINDK